MYTIKHTQNTSQDFNVLEIENTKKTSYAKIYLDMGASLQELTVNGKTIIQDLTPLTYSDTYASSVLFPFANRIKDGTYTFDNKSFQLETNQTEENNALHGLIYNKSFKIIDQKASKTSAHITLEYNETNSPKGFPYNYKIQLTYTLSDSGLSLKVSVKNTDIKTFPFTLGWHPYFISTDLAKSALRFNSTKKLQIGERNITTTVEPIAPIDTFQIKNKKLDDCWALNTNTVQFKTPSYHFELSSSVNDNFLQLYTPPHDNAIAIEPTTGVSNSFNNAIGLQTLEGGKSYHLTWNIKLI